MFNPNNTTDFTKFWNRLSTFYDFVPRNEKEVIETYWEQLFNGLEGLSYDLAQSTLAGYLNYTPGYIEDQYQEYDIWFSGDNRNVEIENLSIPITTSGNNETPSGDNVIYNYKITALDESGETTASDSLIIISGQTDLSSNSNTINWLAVSGASSYNVYGRLQNQYYYISTISGLTFIDDGTISVNTSLIVPVTNTTIKSYLYKIPNDYAYLTIPVLSGINTGNVLLEGTDYELEGLHYIRFFDAASNYVYDEYTDEREIFNAPQALFILPSLLNLYFKSFGALNDPEEVINDNAYLPYISGWSTASYFDQRRLYAEHLKYFSHALTNALSKGPSFKNLKDAFCLISGMPFAYEAGTVSEILEDENDNYLTISGGNTYQIPLPLTLAVTEGSSVAKYDILASGVTFHDYISSSGIIEQVTEDNPEQFWYTLGIQRSNRTYGLNYYAPFLNYYTDSLLPAGLLANYFNLPPTATLTADKDFYDGGEIATISGLISDPETDILEYLWTHELPLTDFIGTTPLECTIIGSDTEQMSTTLTTPLVDRYYLFNLNVSDSDNSPDFEIEVNVSGLYSFTSWGDTDFILGDCELRYIYLT